MINSLIASPIKCVILSLILITVAVLSINTDNMKTCFQLLSVQRYTKKLKLPELRNKSNVSRQKTNSNKNQMSLLSFDTHKYDCPKTDHSLRYYVCPQNMNNARFVCEFKGINAQELETSVLATCQDFFQNQQLYSKINHTIQQRLKRQRDIETKTTLNHDQLIEKLAQGKIDAETFREQTQSLHQQSKPISSISAYQIRKAVQNIIQQRFTLNMLYPYIDEINISKNKSLAGIYFKTNH